MSDLTSILPAMQVDMERTFGFDATRHINPEYQDNVWGQFDNLHPLDCESVFGIAAAELQLLGYTTATVGKAYPTSGQFGNTDATVGDPPQIPGDGHSYFLTFAINYFEGFISVSPPDIAGSQPMAYTIFEDSGVLLGNTACNVDPQSVANKVAFRVLTSSYTNPHNIVPITYLTWATAPGDVDPSGSVYTLLQQVPLPLNGCLN